MKNINVFDSSNMIMDDTYVVKYNRIYNIYYIQYLTYFKL